MSPNVAKAFDRWIRHDTWFTGHPNDEARFYRFIWVYYALSRRSPNARALREKILERWGAHMEPQAIHYSQLAETLYEFAKARTPASRYQLIPQPRCQSSTRPGGSRTVRVATRQG